MHDVHVVLALSTRPFISASGCLRACILGVFLGHLGLQWPVFAPRLRRGRIQKQAQQARRTWASTVASLQPTVPALSQAA